MNLGISKKIVPYGAKVWLREKVLNFYGIPASRHGVPEALVTHLRGKSGIALIDVGASSGEFTLGLRRHCGVARALLVEPIPVRCEQLRSKFPEASIQVICAAAGSENEEVEMEVLSWDYSSSLLQINRSDAAFGTGLDLSVKDKIQTDVLTLDVICRQAGFDGRVDLLKLDVQGAEGLALQGASELLRRVDAVWTEVSFRPLYDGAVSFEALYEQCRKAGFILRSISEGFRGTNGELLQADALFVRNA